MKKVICQAVCMIAALLGLLFLCKWCEGEMAFCEALFCAVAVWLFAHKLWGLCNG